MRHERSYWLATLVPRNSEPIPVNETANQIARCVVCEAKSHVFAFHSQVDTLQPCPSTWKELWTGVSLILVSNCIDVILIEFQIFIFIFNYKILFAFSKIIKN